MPKNSKTNPPFKRVSIKGNFEDFKEFYDQNKELIYKSIIDVFYEFKKTRKKTLTLYIGAKIKGLEWDTEFNFTKNESFILKRDIMPYFEEIEDYETCGEIISLHKELTIK
jgi:hypothetical protein